MEKTSVVMLEKTTEMMRKRWTGLVFKMGMWKVRWWMEMSVVILSSRRGRNIDDLSEWREEHTGGPHLEMMDPEGDQGL